MFPYPSGAGLHVGHPLGYIGTDVFGRYRRMKGFNVLHALGYDAFGLPAEQYAIETGHAPAGPDRGERRQLPAPAAPAGPGPRRRGARCPRPTSPTTAGPSGSSCRIFESWYDAEQDRARPIAELRAELAAGTRPTPDGRPWSDLDAVEQRQVVDDHRLAYISEAPVNWCPGLGTVLANEEVTADGRSDRGNFPVFRRNMRQWMMRITAYADRLIDDLDTLDWPDSIKTMQRNWIGRSEGAPWCAFTSGAGPIEVFTTRPDTLFGATFMVLAPEHPMVDALTAARVARAHPPALDRHPLRPRPRPSPPTAPRRRPRPTWPARPRTARRRASSPARSPLNPVNDDLIPIFVADYVLMGYGTGAIMAVPGAGRAGLGVRRALRPAHRAHRRSRPTAGRARPTSATGRPSTAPTPPWTWTAWASPRPSAPPSPGWRPTAGAGPPPPTACATGCSAASATGASRSPSCTTRPACRSACPSPCCPSPCRRSTTSAPARSTRTTRASEPELPLSGWSGGPSVELDLGDGPKRYQRELNVMPQWAGSCWYELRYLDPTNENRFVDPEVERYWMGPPGAGRSRRRRPLRGRRRARRAAPAVRPLLAQGPVRPGRRLVAASRTAACSTRATSWPRRTRTSGRSTSTSSPSRRRADGTLHLSRASPSPASGGRWARA